MGLNPAVSWILDDGALDMLASLRQGGYPVDLACGSARFFVAAATSAAARQRGERQRLLETQPIEIVAVDVSDELQVTILYGHFRKNFAGTTADLAEHEALTWALTHPDAGRSIFVTADKGALFLASLELGRDRACTCMEFAEWLREMDCIDADALLAVARSQKRLLGGVTAFRYTQPVP